MCIILNFIYYLRTMTTWKPLSWNEVYKEMSFQALNLQIDTQRVYDDVESNHY